MKILSYKKNEKDKFEVLCRKIFKFLETDFGCKLVSVIRNVYGTTIVYKNLTTGIKIQFIPYDGYIFVKVIRLLESNIPRYQEITKSKEPLREFYLEDVVTIHKSSLKFEWPPLEKWEDYEILKKELALRANFLKKYATDILNGDFSIFPKLEKIVKKRTVELRDNKND